MKKLPFAVLFLLGTALSIAAQTQVRPRFSTERAGDSPPAATRNRVTANPEPANHVRKEAAEPVSSELQQSTRPAWGDSAVQVNFVPQRLAVAARVAARTQDDATPTVLVKRTSLNVENSRAPANVRSTATTSATSVYRVGVGDVLDIRLANMTTRESTLFTVLKDGTLEYPLISDPMPVVGLTPDEIARGLSAKIKVIQNARPIISIRDYASHAVVVAGAVDNPGRKLLRREAVPLFTVLAEALPRSDAATAVVLRNGKEITLSLSRSQDLSTLIVADDAIRVLSTVRQFVYVGGEVTSAGEKELREGMTLTQVLMAAGGVRAEALSKIRVTRREPNGLLKAEEYNLNAIEAGKSPDPLLQPGDRIEVKRGM